MQIVERFLTVLHDDNGVFIDNSENAKDYSGDAFLSELVSAEDYLYIGYPKPTSDLYLELNVKNTNSNTLSIQYYHEKDAVWKSLKFSDETLGFTRSGFIRWDRPRDNNGNNEWGKTLIDSKMRYWIRIKPSSDFSAGTKIQGLSLVFSNDNDLIEERSNIVSKYAVNQPTGSWILKHQAAKKDIMQKLRNAGNQKVGPTVFDDSDLTEVQRVKQVKDITEWDLFKFEQVRQASKYLTLSKIYLQELSDNPEDKFSMLGKHFEEKHNESMQILLLSMDTDDDGEEDGGEAAGQQFIEIIRP